MTAILLQYLAGLGVALLCILGLLFVFVLICIPYNLQIRAARRDYKALPEPVKIEALEIIRQAASADSCCTLLYRDGAIDAASPGYATRSRIGGCPYSEDRNASPEPDDTAPLTDNASQFLLQIRIETPSLGPVWQGRLIVVSLSDDYEVVIQSYAAPSEARFVGGVEGSPDSAAVVLSHLPIPRIACDGDTPCAPCRYQPGELLNTIPQLKQLLEKHTKDTAAVLAQILNPEIYATTLDAPSVIFCGGSPELIQNPHDPECPLCRQPMRFLFQFGDIIPGVDLGDAGVCYVYGCDEHPDTCSGFIDSH